MKLRLYFARTYLGVLMLFLLGLVIVVLATTFVENAGDLSKNDENGTAVLRLAAFGAVQFAYQVTPIACFLALLVTGTMLARSGELLAAQAAGISVMRVAQSFIVVIVGVAIVTGLAGEYVVPRASVRLEALQQELGRSRDALTAFYQRRTQWYRQGDVLLYLPDVDADAEVFRSVVLYRFEQGAIASVTDAASLAREGNTWILRGAKSYDVATATARTYERLPVALSMSPRDLIDVAGDPRNMSSASVAALIERRKNAGFDAVAHRVELHNRWAFPLWAVFMFALGLPWAMNPSRRRSLAVNLGSGVAAVAAVLSISQVFRLLALARRIPAPLGAWGVDLACLLLLPLSLVAYERYRRRGSLF